MALRFVTIWFRYLKTDWFCRRHPLVKDQIFVLAAMDRGRRVITAVNALAEKENIEVGMTVADARAIFPALQIFDDEIQHPEKILKGLAEWCIRYTDFVAIGPPNGLILDVTGCAHLWGGERLYLKDIQDRLKNLGYAVRATMADTIGAAWALGHFGEGCDFLLDPGQQKEQLPAFPVAALRLEEELIEHLQKLGLRQIRHLITQPRAALCRRFGPGLAIRLDQAMGDAEESVFPVQPEELFCERLPCLEPIITATGIEIALQRLLEIICSRLNQRGRGIRKVVFSGYRVDGRIEKIEIGTHRASNHVSHLYKLFEQKIARIEPALGIDLFMIEVLTTEKILPKQEFLFEKIPGLNDAGLSELMDRLGNRFGNEKIRRYIPLEHHWPERSYKETASLHDSVQPVWVVDRPRPLLLLSSPQPVEVTAPVPDYPPMIFRYLGILHKIKKADGPERIEREWWLEEGPHRDYYAVEDEEGRRYWIFRSGHYEEKSSPDWFIHGFFA